MRKIIGNVDHVSYFGSAVSASGNLAVIGAYLDDARGGNSGSAFVFDLTTGQELYKLLPTDGATGDNFGGSVAIDGNTAVIGARNNDVNGDYSGSAYLFSWGSSVITDSDEDLLDDAWERLHFGNLEQTGAGDPDGDGLDNEGEQTTSSNPNLADSDNDGLDDGSEVTNGMNPTVANSETPEMRALLETLKRDSSMLEIDHPLIWVEDGEIHLSIQLWSGSDLNGFTELDDTIEFTAPLPEGNASRFYQIRAR